MVTEGHTDFQAGVHTHAILPIQQVGHEPIQVQPANLTPAGFRFRFALQTRGFRHALLVAPLDIIL